MNPAIKVKDAYVLSKYALGGWLVLLVLNNFLNGNVWFWEYFVFIPPYFFFFGAILLLGYSAYRKHRKAVLLSLLAVLTAAVVLPITFSSSPKSLGPGLRVITFNQFFTETDSDELLSLISSQQPDVVLIQENYEVETLDRKKILQMFPGWSIVQASDLLTLSRHPIISASMGKGNYLKTTIAVGDKQIDVYNVHLQFPFFTKSLEPDTYWKVFDVRKAQYVALLSDVASREKCKIVGGDFNTPANSAFLRPFFEGYNDAAATSSGYPITWNSVLPLFRVDYIFSSKSMQPLEYSAFPTNLSDHYLVRSDIAFQGTC